MVCRHAPKRLSSIQGCDFLVVGYRTIVRYQFTKYLIDKGKADIIFPPFGKKRFLSEFMLMMYLDDTLELAAYPKYNTFKCLISREPLESTLVFLEMVHLGRCPYCIYLRHMCATYTVESLREYFHVL